MEAHRLSGARLVNVRDGSKSQRGEPQCEDRSNPFDGVNTPLPSAVLSPTVCQLSMASLPKSSRNLFPGVAALVKCGYTGIL